MQALSQFLREEKQCKPEKKLNLGTDWRPVTGEMMRGIQFITPAVLGVHIDLGDLSENSVCNFYRGNLLTTKRK